MFYQIQYQPKGGRWLNDQLEDLVFDDYFKAHQSLQEWRKAVPKYQYRLIKCEVLDD